MGGLETIAGGAARPAQIGRYAVLERLATGGMAEVYLARLGGFGGFEKLVAIKRIRPELLGEPRAIEYFLDEARLVASLEHSNIAQVHEMGFVGGSYFFVMEYIHGADLRQLLEAAHAQNKRVPIACAVQIISGVCAGLHYAHDKCDPGGNPLGIIHRDVSPSNVLVSHDGAIKLCDFGIAKTTKRRTETAGGALKGKFGYMSPEQARSKPLDRRSDVFSIGILLYEATTLTRLFDHGSDFETLRAIAEDRVTPPSQRVAGYPPELERIVLRALAKDPAERYQTAQALQLDLEDFAREHKLSMSPIHLSALMSSLFDPNRVRDTLRELPRPPRVAAAASVVPPPPARVPQGTMPPMQTEIDACGDIDGPDAAETMVSSAADLAALLAIEAGDSCETILVAAHAAPTDDVLTVPVPKIDASLDLQIDAHLERSIEASVVGPMPRPPAAPPPTLAELASRYSQSSAGLTFLGPAPAPPPNLVPMPPLPPPAVAKPRQGYRAALLAGALVSVIATVGASLAGAAQARAHDRETTAAIAAEAGRLQGVLEQAARTARDRAAALATAPALQAALAADQPSSARLAADPAVRLAPGEALELFRSPGVSWLRLPDRAPAARSPAGSGRTRLEVRDGRFVIIVGTAVAGAMPGATINLAVSLELAAGGLAEVAERAAIVGLDSELALVAPADPSATGDAEPLTVAIPSTELGGQLLALVATPREPAGLGWVAPVRYAGGGVAALLLALYVASLGRRRGRMTVLPY